MVQGLQGRKSDQILNKEEYVKYILDGTDFKLVTHYILNYWDIEHKKELLHGLVDTFDDDGVSGEGG